MARRKADQEARDAVAATPPSATMPLLDVDMAARLLMVSPRRIQQLASDGWIAREKKRGGYPLIPLVQGYVRFLQDEKRKESRGASESRLRDARTKEVELRAARLDREVIDTAEAIDALDRIVGMIVEMLVGLPAQITRNESERRRIEGLIDAHRARLADRLSEVSQSLRTGGDAVSSDDEDDA